MFEGIPQGMKGKEQVVGEGSEIQDQKLSPLT